ncbi:MAG: preprotein translocase SecE subunit [Planctomycetota bacterium]|jgi:preprotein translocase SecE subunit
MVYRKDQGRMVRMAAFWSLAILLFYGCVSLHTQLGVSFGESMTKPLVSGFERIPLLGMVPNGSLVVSIIALGVGLTILNRWLSKPNNADLMIDTEHELQKVTWPTLEETISGSVLVIGCVLFLMAFLAAADYGLVVIARRVLLNE